MAPKYNGYVDLWFWINPMFFKSSEQAYFITNFSDEVRFLEKNWFKNLYKYRTLYKDNIFRLRTF